MTISTEPVPLSYNGDGSTVAFAITWKYFATSDVRATLRSAAGVETAWVLNTDFTLTAAGDDDGGTLTATTAPATGTTLVIELDTPNTQSTSLPLGGPLPSDDVEDAIDRLTQICAKLEQLFNRSLRVPRTDTQNGDDLELPIDSTRASKFLAFDSNGDPIAAAGTSADLGPVSTFVNTLLDDANAVTFLTTFNANFTGTNTALGGSALDSITSGTNNAAFGLNALTANTTGAANVAVGQGALAANTTADNNTAIGDGALFSNTTGATNTAVGSAALDVNTTGGNNVAVGVNALGVNTTASNNTAIGTGALDANTTGASNVAVGLNALGANTTADDNTAIGKDALLVNTTGASNVAVGKGALDANTTASGNTAVGLDALGANTTGVNNVAIGKDTLLVNTNGNNNIAIGVGALDAHTGSDDNVAIGRNALGSDTTGSSNVAIGSSSLVGNTTGTLNTAVGLNTLDSNTTGTKNTALGLSAGETITTGSNLTALGYNAQASSATATNEITLGDANVATLRCQVTTITALSDRRDKRDIQDIGLGLDFITKLKPVKYKWAMRDGTKKPDIFEAGFIAQDFQQVQIEENAEWMRLVYESNPDKLEATPGKLIPVLVRAIQELSERVRQLESE